MTLSITPNLGYFGYNSSREFEIEHVPHTRYEFDDAYEITIRVSDMQTLENCLNQRCYVIVGHEGTEYLKGEFYLPDVEMVTETRTERSTVATNMGRLVRIHLHPDGDTEIDHEAIAAHE